MSRAKLITDLDAARGEGTDVLLLPLHAAGDEASLPATSIERSEAAQRHPSERFGYLARRRLLRRAVARRFDIAPGDVAIARNAQGAPQVTSAREAIFVSLASRNDVVAITLSDRPVGVDVEIIETPAPEPAWNILHPRERVWLTAQDDADRALRFLALWCAKEAYLKAIGLGLRREPADILIDLADKDAVRIEDGGRPVALDRGFVVRAIVEETPVIVACLTLSR